jgi:hypothetical protein
MSISVLQVDLARRSISRFDAVEYSAYSSPEKGSAPHSRRSARQASYLLTQPLIGCVLGGYVIIARRILDAASDQIFGDARQHEVDGFE